MNDMVILLQEKGVLSGATGVPAADNVTRGPKMVLEEFFSGDLTAAGVILGRFGKVRRSFTAEMHGSWKEQKGVLRGVLTESFLFDDDQRLERGWALVQTGPESYEATAEDVKGTATLATAGNVLRMDYTLEIPLAGHEVTVQVEDWLWHMREGVVVNKSIMRKWGIRVGEILTTIFRTA